MSYDAGAGRQAAGGQGLEPPRSVGQTAGRRGKVRWQAPAAVVLVLLVLVAVAGAIGSAVLPVRWARMIGSQAGGDPAGGIVMGMVIGFPFTLAPLLAAWQSWHYRIRRPWQAALLAAAVLLAVPNLLTIGIAAGSSTSSRQARRILGAEATWFVQWTLYSAIAAALVFAAIVLLWTMWRRCGRMLTASQAEGRNRTGPGSA